MKKTINENTLKSIIRESLKKYLKESMDAEFDMDEEDLAPDMDYDEPINESDDDDYDIGWDKSKWCGDLKFSEKYHNNNKKTKKTATKGTSDEYNKHAWDKSRMCGDAGFHAANEKRAKEKANLAESKLKKIISEAVMKVLNESVEEGGFGNFMRRTFNSSSVNANANYVDRVYQNYLKKFNQIKGHLEPGQINIIQRNLKSIEQLAARARNGEKIGEQQVGYYTKAIDRWLGYGNDQRSAYMAKRNAPSQPQSYNNSRMDSYDTSDGISHFGNGDAYRA